MKSNEEKVLSVQHLTVSYDKTPALWDINFEVPSRRLVGIVGPNGAGKSTLIKALLDLIPRMSGKSLFFGQPLSKVRGKVAYVPQRASVDWDFPITALEVVLMGRYGKLGLFRRPSKADREAANYALRQVGLEELANRQISELSGGQQQRVFLARALLQDAEIYLMDEPFTGVDIATEKVIVNLLKGLMEQNKTVFVVHHDLNTVENYFDWMILLNTRLVAAGPREEVFTTENIAKTYGKSYALFDQALMLSESKKEGLR